MSGSGSDPDPERAGVARPDPHDPTIPTGPRPARTRESALEELCEEIVGMVSHDFRGPISSILTWVELLRSDSSGTQREKGLAGLERAARAQERLIRSVVAFARMRSGSLTLHLAEVDLRAIVDRAVHASLPWARSRGVRVAVSGDLPHRVVADADLLELLLAHLIDNAVQHSPSGERVEIALGASPGHASVEIRDAGPGLDAREAAELLLRARDPGPLPGRRRRGLGLPLALGLLDRQAGSLELESAGPGAGTVVRIHLPAGESGGSGGQGLDGRGVEAGRSGGTPGASAPSSGAPNSGAPGAAARAEG